MTAIGVTIMASVRQPTRGGGGDLAAAALPSSSSGSCNCKGSPVTSSPMASAALPSTDFAPASDMAPPSNVSSRAFSASSASSCPSMPLSTTSNSWSSESSDFPLVFRLALRLGFRIFRLLLRLVLGNLLLLLLDHHRLRLCRSLFLLLHRLDLLCFPSGSCCAGAAAPP